MTNIHIAWIAMLNNGKSKVTWEQCYVIAFEKDSSEVQFTLSLNVLRNKNLLLKEIFAGRKNYPTFLLIFLNFLKKKKPKNLIKQPIYHLNTLTLSTRQIADFLGSERFLSQISLTSVKKHMIRIMYLKRSFTPI